MIVTIQEILEDWLFRTWSRITPSFLWLWWFKLPAHPPHTFFCLSSQFSASTHPESTRWHYTTPASKNAIELRAEHIKEEEPCQNKMSVGINLALLSINLLFNLISSWAMQKEANLRVQGGSKRCGMINFDKIHRMIESRQPGSISSGNNEKKEKKKRQKPFHTVKSDGVYTDFLISLFR